MKKRIVLVFAMLLNGLFLFACGHSVPVGLAIDSPERAKVIAAVQGEWVSDNAEHIFLTFEKDRMTFYSTRQAAKRERSSVVKSEFNQYRGTEDIKYDIIENDKISFSTGRGVYMELLLENDGNGGVQMRMTKSYDIRADKVTFRRTNNVAKE